MFSIFDHTGDGVVSEQEILEQVLGHAVVLYRVVIPMSMVCGESGQFCII